MPQEPNASSAYEKRPLAPEVVKCKAQCPSRVALESDFHFVHLGPLFADRARRTGGDLAVHSDGCHSGSGCTR